MGRWIDDGLLAVTTFFKQKNFHPSEDESISLQKSFRGTTSLHSPFGLCSLSRLALSASRLRCNGLTRAGLLSRRRLYFRPISSTFLPGDIQRVVSEGRLQPVAFPSLAVPGSLTPPGGGRYSIVAGLYTVFQGASIKVKLRAGNRSKSLRLLFDFDRNSGSSLTLGRWMPFQS